MCPHCMPSAGGWRCSQARDFDSLCFFSSFARGRRACKENISEDEQLHLSNRTTRRVARWWHVSTKPPSSVRLLKSQKIDGEMDKEMEEDR